MSKLLLRGLTPPPAASAAGFTSLLYNAQCDDLSKVDTTNTLAPGFDLYISSKWPNCTPSGTAFRTFVAQAASSYSIASKSGAPDNSCVYVSDNTTISSGGSNIVLASACDDGAGGYNGFVFGPGGYTECRYNRYYTPAFGTDAFWGDPVNWLRGDAMNNMVEVDVLETGSSSVSHAGTVVWDVPTQSNTGHGTLTNNGPANDSDFHTYGWLWKTKAQNGGTGLLQFYLDDVFQSQITYTTGDKAIMDTHSYVLWVSSNGRFAPLAVDWIRAWG